MVVFGATSLVKGPIGSASLSLDTCCMLTVLVLACRVHRRWSKH